MEADFHCYQLPEEKSYRVVIRHLHHSTPPEDISEDLKNLGYNVRRVTNVRHPVTKAELPLFFVDLEKTEKSKEIFNVKYLLYSKIAVEEPRRRNDLMQCHKCQEYNHTKGYCQHAPKCVKCGEQHKSQDCSKPLSVPASCANCGGNHPANYKGCEVYKALRTLRSQRPRTRSTTRQVVDQTTRTKEVLSTQPQQPPTSALTSLHRPNVSYASLLSYRQKQVQAIKHSNPTPEHQPLPTPSSHNVSKPPVTAKKSIPTDVPHKSPKTPEVPPSSTPQDPFSLFSSFLNKLETLLTPLISLMSSLISDILPKLLK